MQVSDAAGIALRGTPTRRAARRVQGIVFPHTYPLPDAPAAGVREPLGRSVQSSSACMARRPGPVCDDVASVSRTAGSGEGPVFGCVVARRGLL